MSSFDALWKCHLVIFSQKCPKLHQCFFKWINWIKSRIPRWIWKILFVLSSYEFLAMLEGKIGDGPFLRVQSDELTVCSTILLHCILLFINSILWLSQSSCIISYIYVLYTANILMVISRANCYDSQLWRKDGLSQEKSRLKTCLRTFSNVLL